MNVSDLLGQSPSARNAAMRNTGNPTHCGPDNWEHDLATTNDRALAAIVAKKNKQPRPIWGRHNAGVNTNA